MPDQSEIVAASLAVLCVIPAAFVDGDRHIEVTEQDRRAQRTWFETVNPSIRKDLGA